MRENLVLRWESASWSEKGLENSSDLSVCPWAGPRLIATKKQESKNFERRQFHSLFGSPLSWSNKPLHQEVVSWSDLRLLSGIKPCWSERVWASWMVPILGFPGAHEGKWAAFKGTFYRKSVFHCLMVRASCCWNLWWLPCWPEPLMSSSLAKAACPTAGRLPQVPLCPGDGLWGEVQMKRAVIYFNP